MDYQYVSIDRIFTKLIRDVTDEFAEGDVIEWCGEALEFIGANKFYEEAIAFIEVKNHQCQLPAGLHSIIMVARDNHWYGPAQNPICPRDVVEDIKCVGKPANFIQEKEGVYYPTGTPSNPDYIVLDCNGQPINDYDIAYYRPYFDLKAEYYGWRRSRTYGSRYTPVRLATHALFNNLVCSENPIDYMGCNDEYTVIKGSILRTSFLEGSVAIPYLRQVIDTETGYPMIPDNISYTTAITKYVTMKMFERQFYNGRDGAQAKMSKAEADWHWYCKQAGNIDKMPYGIDEHQNMMDQRSYLIPNRNSYYGFFGNMAKPENRSFNNPDRGVSLFRGN